MESSVEIPPLQFRRFNLGIFLGHGIVQLPPSCAAPISPTPKPSAASADVYKILIALNDARRITSEFVDFMAPLQGSPSVVGKTPLL